MVFPLTQFIQYCLWLNQKKIIIQPLGSLIITINVAGGLFALILTLDNNLCKTV